MSSYIDFKKATSQMMQSLRSTITHTTIWINREISLTYFWSHQKHKMLLCKLAKYGLKDVVLKLLKSSLTQHEQKFHMSNSLNGSHNMSCVML